MGMIPVAKPIIAKNAQKYIIDCLKSGWVSSAGHYIERFEKKFSRFIGVKFAIACNSGTSALHLSLASLNIGPNDEVIIPALTMIATALPIIYTQATPVLVDVNPQTGNIDPIKVSQKISKKTKAIIAVHVNGNPANLPSLLKIAKESKLTLIEDAAQAHGSYCQIKNTWKATGSIGDLGCFSFYANKLITCGEGGMVTTNNSRLAEKIRSLRNLARSPKKHYYHQEIGFAYRLSNLQAALGVAQMEETTSIFKKKRAINLLYYKLLQNIPGISFLSEEKYAKSINWQMSILLSKKADITRDQLAAKLSQVGIETRIFVIPLHKQPAFVKRGYFKNEKYPIAESISQTGLTLPSGPDISEKEIYYVVSKIKQTLKIS